MKRLDFATRFGFLPSTMIISHRVILKEASRADRTHVVSGDFIAIDSRSGAGFLGMLDLKSGRFFYLGSIAEVIIDEKILEAYRASIKAQDELDEKDPKSS